MNKEWDNQLVPCNRCSWSRLLTMTASNKCHWEPVCYSLLNSLLGRLTVQARPASHIHRYTYYRILVTGFNNHSTSVTWSLSKSNSCRHPHHVLHIILHSSSHSLYAQLAYTIGTKAVTSSKSSYRLSDIYSCSSSQSEVSIIYMTVG